MLLFTESIKFESLNAQEQDMDYFRILNVLRMNNF